MAFDSADYMKIWSAQTIKELREKTMMYRMFDTDWEAPWVAGQNTVNIPDPKFSTAVVAGSRNRGANWANAGTNDQDNIAFTRSGGYAVTNEIDWDDVLEIAWPVLARYRSRQEYAIRKAIDDAFLDAAITAAGDTLTGGTSGSTYVARTSPYRATIASGRRHPVAEVLELFALRMARADVLDGDASPTGDAGMPFVVIQPELALSFQQWLDGEKIQFEPLSRAMFYENPAAMKDPNPLHMYRGVMVFTSNHLSVPSSGNEWRFYGGCRSAMAVGIRPPIMQYYPPESNQISEKPAHILRQIGDYAAHELDDDLHAKLEVHEA